jgi:hypothetical protein
MIEQRLVYTDREVEEPPKATREVNFRSLQEIDCSANTASRIQSEKKREKEKKKKGPGRA